MRGYESLRGYQRHAIEFMHRVPHGLLWLDMGLGKTVCALTALAEWRVDNEARAALIVAPLRVVQTVWQQEARSWAHLQHLDVRILRGTAQERLAALFRSPPADAYVINYENLLWLAEVLPSGPWPFDVVFWDEATAWKDPGAKRFRVWRHRIGRFRRSYALTATPTLQNNLLDVWGQAFMVDGGAALGPSFGQFQMTWFYPTDRYNRKWSPRPHARETILRKLEPMVLRLDAEDWLDVPEKIPVVHRVNPPPAVQRISRRLMRDLSVTLANGISLTAPSSGVAAMRAHQLAQGAVYAIAPAAATATAAAATDPLADVDMRELGALRRSTDSNFCQPFLHIHDAKLDMLVEIIEATGDPILCAVAFRHDVARIRERLANHPRFAGSAPIEERVPLLSARNAGPLVAAWNRGQVPLLLAAPQSAGHGLNLQHGGSTIVWFGLPYSAADYHQLNGRLHRQGQTRPVVIHHIIATGTVDEAIYRINERRLTDHAAVLDVFRSFLPEPGAAEAAA